MDILVEGGGIVEHITHVRHIWNIPRSDVSVEGGGTVEHIAHVRHI